MEQLYGNIGHGAEEGLLQKDSANDGLFDHKRNFDIEVAEESLRTPEEEIRLLRNKIALLERSLVEKEVTLQQREEEALKDSLTGLPNRRYFEEELKRFQDIFRRHTVDGAANFYSIVALDLDGFKAINDTFGHEAGDICLRLVAQALKRATRSSDFIARQSGDEFIILLPDVGEDGARRVGEKILAAIEEDASQLLQEALHDSTANISASIGVISYGDKTGEKDISQEDMVVTADYLRYLAKALGKKAVVTFKDSKEYDNEGIFKEKYLSSKNKTTTRLSVAA